MSLRLYARRKKLLELYYAGAFTPKTFTMLAETEGVSANALRKDWRNKLKWERLVWMAEESEDDYNWLLYIMQMALERAVSLMRAADQDSVKVAAIGRVADIARRLIELKQSLGQLPKVADKIKVEAKIKHEGLDQQAILVITEGVLEEEAARIHPKENEAIRDPTDSS